MLAPSDDRVSAGRARPNAGNSQSYLHRLALLPRGQVIDPPQPGPIADRTFEIEFLDPGVEAHTFTFG